MEKKTEKLKIMTIFGTRPEIIRLSRVLAKFDKYTNHVTVHTGQSYDYEMNQVFFDELEIRKPDYFLGVKAKTLGEQISNIILKSEKVLIKERPDAVLVLGDTNSSLSAIVAKRMKIPIFHMEAGNRCFDEKVPEEVNRRIVDHISDINLPYSENARLYLIQEGINPGAIFVTGSPMAEVFDYYREKSEKSKIIEKLKLKKDNYFVASIHREENIEDNDNLKIIIESLNAIVDKYDKPVIFSTHPRTAGKIKNSKLRAHKLVRFEKPFGYFDYIKLQKNAFCVLSDSGTIQEESSLVGFPAIQVRMSSERPEAFDEGALILSGLYKDSILEAIDITTRQLKAGEEYNIPFNYKDKNVSGKVLRLVVGLSRIIQKKRGYKRR